MSAGPTNGGPQVRGPESVRWGCQSEPAGHCCSFKDFVQRTGPTAEPSFDADAGLGPPKKEQLEYRVQQQPNGNTHDQRDQIQLESPNGDSREGSEAGHSRSKSKWHRRLYQVLPNRNNESTEGT